MLNVSDLPEDVGRAVAEKLAEEAELDDPRELVAGKRTIGLGVYRLAAADGESFVVYSVGDNLRDEGGRRAKTWAQERGGIRAKGVAP